MAMGSYQVYPPDLTSDACCTQLEHRFGMTPAEARIGIHLPLGLTDKEIASQCGRQLATVKAQVARILLRTGATTRSGAASIVVATLWARHTLHPDHRIAG